MGSLKHRKAQEEVLYECKHARWILLQQQREEEEGGGIRERNAPPIDYLTHISTSDL